MREGKQEREREQERETERSHVLPVELSLASAL